MTANSDFEDLFEAHYDDLLRFALRRVREPADAADVVAETWAVAWRRRDSMPSGDERRLWLFGVARRVLANQARGRLRRSLLADRLREELATRAQLPVEHSPHVEQALAVLSRADRDLLVMLAWDGLQPEDVAKVLGCSPGTARVRIHRARRRFRAALDSVGFHTTYTPVIRDARHPAQETS
ncbi:MAG: RNA polymerase sigma factor [Mycobacteriales bacterium]